MIYNFTKAVSVPKLEAEIRKSVIVTALDYISLFGNDLDIAFKETLSEGDETILSDLVTNHINTPFNDSSKVEVISTPAMASKTLPTGEKIYERIVGIQEEVTLVDENHLNDIIDFSIPFPHAKLLGVQFVNCTALDTVDFEVYDDALGTVSGVPNKKLNQFGFTANMSEGFYDHKSNFDADVYSFLIIRITYKSKSTKTIGINFKLNEVKA